MEKMVIAQKKLENALLILATDADIKVRHERVYIECLCHLSPALIPNVLRGEYLKLLRLTKMLDLGTAHFHDSLSLLSVEDHQDFASELAASIIALLTRLTEWMAIEKYLCSQQHALR